MRHPREAAAQFHSGRRVSAMRWDLNPPTSRSRAVLKWSSYPHDHDPSSALRGPQDAMPRCTRWTETRRAFSGAALAAVASLGPAAIPQPSGQRTTRQPPELFTIRDYRVGIDDQR